MATELLCFLLLFYGFSLGTVFGWIAGRVGGQKKKEFNLTIMIQLDATQETKISAVGKDAEGNVVDLSGTDLKIEAVAIEGEFGTINDEMDTFNPGEAGAKGTIKGSVTIDEVEYVASVEVELVAGALTEIGLEFAPVE